MGVRKRSDVLRTIDVSRIYKYVKRHHAWVSCPVCGGRCGGSNWVQKQRTSRSRNGKYKNINRETLKTLKQDFDF